MFCDQCEQTAKGTGCTIAGVCGKKSDVALIQDQLVYQLRELASYVQKAAAQGKDVTAYDDFIAETLFATLTNVNFDPEALRNMQAEAFKYSKELATQIGNSLNHFQHTLDDYLAQLPETVVGIGAFSSDADVDSAMQILLYGMKGTCAYKSHAARLGERDEWLSGFIRKGLMAGTQYDSETRDLGGWLEILLECGKANLKAMELLDKGNTSHFGDPVPTEFSTGHKKGKAIMMSGHDYLDLEALLKQTEGKGINVYTHGEMLPAHGYPKLKAYKHLVGNFGTAWENQQKEFPNFPGAIIFNTNCLQNPKDYSDRVFTTNNVGWPGCVHCKDRDFSAAIEKSLELEGFNDDDPGKTVMTGFGRKTMLDAAPAVLDAVKKGQLKHIFLVGGCDGARPTRKYYTEFVEKTPKDTVILTLACGKFRFFDKDLGKLGDLPRYLDCGQCGDAYTAASTALALADALNCGINDLPLSMIISWYEQKAVAVLLTLLYLGVKNIILGPTLPAFISPEILKVLVEKYNIRLMTTPEEDLKTCLGEK